MKILVLAIAYWPEESGNAVFTVPRCEFFAQHGHEVTVCTGFPFYPAWQIPAHYRRKLFTREEHNGVTILRSYVYVPSRVSSFRRVIHEASFTASSFVRALGRSRPDLIFVVSPPLGLALPAFLLSRMWKIPYVFYVSDMQPDAAFDLGMLPPGPVMPLLYKLERFAYRHAALIGTLTSGMRQKIVAKGVPAEKVALFQHCAEPALFGVPLTGGGQEFRRANGLGQRFVVLHSGNMGVKQGLEVVLGAAARSLNDEGIEYLLAGDGAVRSSLMAHATALGLRNLRFLPLQSREDYFQMLGAADVALITQQRSVSDILFPGKTVAYLTAGRPVVASLDAGTEAGRTISEARAGVVVEPEDPAALLDGINLLRENDGLRLDAGQAGRNHARRYWDRERILPELELRLNQVVSNGAQN